MTRVSLIAAVAADGVMGYQGDLPWPPIKEDFAWFKQHTKGKPIIMGRKTWDSLKEPFKPLPGRRNIVISRSVSHIDGAEVFASITDAIASCPEPEVMVIGGAEIYAQAMPLAHRMYLTFINADYVGDTFFPAWNPDNWQTTETSTITTTAGLEVTFNVLDRN